MKTVLALVQEFCLEYSQPAPTSLQGNSDAGAQQYRAILNAVGKEVHSKNFWQATERRVTWNSVAGADQGSITTLWPNMDYAETATLWDMSLRKPVFGPVPGQQWQALQAFMPGGPQYQYRIANDRLEINPAFGATVHSLSVIYKSIFWVCANGAPTVASKEYFTSDDDTCIFQDQLMSLGLKAKWLRIKQMPYQNEEDDYLGLLDTLASRDSVNPTIFMDSNAQSLRPGIWVPAGSWGVNP